MIYVMKIEVITKYVVRCDTNTNLTKSFYNENVAKGYLAGIESQLANLKGTLSIQKIELLARGAE